MGSNPTPSFEFMDDDRSAPEPVPNTGNTRRGARFDASIVRSVWMSTVAANWPCWSHGKGANPREFESRLARFEGKWQSGYCIRVLSGRGESPAQVRVLSCPLIILNRQDAKDAEEKRRANLPLEHGWQCIRLVGGRS